MKEVQPPVQPQRKRKISIRIIHSNTHVFYYDYSIINSSKPIDNEKKLPTFRCANA